MSADGGILVAAAQSLVVEHAYTLSVEELNMYSSVLIQSYSIRDVGPFVVPYYWQVLVIMMIFGGVLI